MPVSDSTAIRLSDKYYNDVDVRFSRVGDDSKCIQLISELGNDFESTELTPVCKILTGALDNYGIMPTVLMFNRYRCKYFNLWLCDRLSKVLNNFEHPKFNDIKTKIKVIWGKSDINGKCEYHFISYIENSNYAKIKNLYEYALNYKYMKHHFDKGGVPCSERDKQYIKDSLNLYNEVKNECRTVSDKNRLLCTALSDVKSVYNNDQLSKLTCNGEMLKDETSRGLQIASYTQIPYTQLQVDAEKTYKEDVPPAEVSLFSLPTLDGPHPVSDSHKAMTIVFPILGILLIFFLSYKFSPVGAWVNNHLGKNKNSFNVNEEEINELLENSLYSTNENINKSYNNVGYHPAVNT
ncbi:PIR protein [Plasmodium ovale]|uniref:PIR Superfamily Protein n=2 Tax=Plasmodium ovale TaxID=36330 RepID=A0A1A8XF67_PLAOA|nr:PIR Superfamily Protein [Plasmodium ovale curtisi]SBT83750.1 PIR protein [Plasmodium ovale]